MKIQTKAVHAGDRKKAGPHVPVATPIYTAASYFYESMEELDRAFSPEHKAYCYARYDNPTNAALEEQAAALESGHGALACGSGMAAVHMALLAALADRRKSILAANALYGATVSLLLNVMQSSGVEVRFVDVWDLDALRKTVEEVKPGCILIETISNPLLRVGDIGKIAEMAAWIRDLTAQRQAFREKMEEFHGLMVPSEDPDWDDLGPAFPGWNPPGRDAILQPPKPQIIPSAKILQLAAERDTSPEAAD